MILAMIPNASINMDSFKMSLPQIAKLGRNKKTE